MVYISDDFVVFCYAKVIVLLDSKQYSNSDWMSKT